jgi:hypothetical protein
VTKPVKTGSFPSGNSAYAFDPVSQRLLVLVFERTGPGSITIVQNWLRK